MFRLPRAMGIHEAGKVLETYLQLYLGLAERGDPNTDPEVYDAFYKSCNKGP